MQVFLSIDKTFSIDLSISFIDLLDFHLFIEYWALGFERQSLPLRQVVHSYTQGHTPYVFGARCVWELIIFQT